MVVNEPRKDRNQVMLERLCFTPLHICSDKTDSLLLVNLLFFFSFSSLSALSSIGSLAMTLKKQKQKPDVWVRAQSPPW